MDIMFIVINRYIISFIDKMNRCDIRFFFMFVLNLFHCHHIYGELFLLNFDAMKFHY